MSTKDDSMRSMTDKVIQEGFEIPQEADGEYPAEEETF
jgi:hypothetical protein